MTSSLSSAKQFKTSFLQCLKKFSFHGILIFVLLLPFFAEMHGMFRQQEMYLSGLTEYDYLADYVFSLHMHMYSDEMGYVCLVIGLSAMFLALHCWRFLHVKKTLNVYCSLGASASTLFWSRFSACLVLLVAPVLLIFAGLLVCNLLLYGSSPELWAATAIYSLSFIAIGVFAFAMTTLSMCVTGASVESFLCAGCLIALPVTFFYALKYLTATLLYGNAVDHRLHNIVTGDVIFDGSFLPELRFLDFFLPVSDYNFADGFAWEKAYGEWSNPGWEYPLVWLAVGALVSGLCFVCFKRRKNENAGFLGKNPALVGVSCLSLAFLLTVPAYYMISNLALRRELGIGAVLVLIGALILFFVYIIIMAVLLRGKKMLAKAMPVALAVCAVFVCVCSVFVFGGFGFADRIPDKQDIESVSVSAGSYMHFADGSGAFYENYYTDDLYEDAQLQQHTAEDFIIGHLDYFSESNPALVCNLTDEADIDTVLSVHRLLSQAENEDKVFYEYPVALQYKLKNGKTLTRYYECATPEVAQLLQAYENHADVKLHYEKQFKDAWVENISLLAPAASNVTLLPWNMLEAGLGTEIVDAFVQDLRDGYMPIARYGTAAPIGYVSLSGNIRKYDYAYEGDYEIYDYAYTTMMATVPQEYYGEYLLTDFTEPVSATLGKTVAGYDYCEFQNVYPVYADMKATLAVLEKYDVLQYFTPAEQPVAAKLLRTTLADSKAESPYSWYYRSKYFRASYLTGDGLSFADVMPDGKFTTDAQLLASLMQNSFMRYPVTLDGCLVAFEYADGTSVLTYVPIESVPEQLR